MHTFVVIFQLLLPWLDRVLKRFGLIRISRTSRIQKFSFDSATREINVEFGGGWRTRIHGYVCPTPDGPLKKIVHTPNPYLGFGSMYAPASDV